MRASGRILIVEDDDDLCEALSLVLQNEGHEVASEADGRAALERLQAAPEATDLIIADLIMPVMDGRQFCAQGRRTRCSPRSPW